MGEDSKIRETIQKNIKGKAELLQFAESEYFKLDESAIIELDGRLLLGRDNFAGDGRASTLRMDQNARLSVKGDFEIYYDADIILFRNAVLELGRGSFINSGCRIRCHKNIKIGDRCAISHDFTVMDSDAHRLEGKENTKPVTIGDHVWIGTRVTILKGVNIGDNAVIAAGSVVTRDVPANCMAAGNPARVVRENIAWTE